MNRIVRLLLELLAVLLVGFGVVPVGLYLRIPGDIFVALYIIVCFAAGILSCQRCIAASIPVRHRDSHGCDCSLLGLLGWWHDPREQWVVATSCRRSTSSMETASSRRAVNSA
ncbi:MAG: hypothetical protein JWM95_3685 [Gemmatimonadetes bacterium]|nr:hypothetical protein [Gemmatimonadota bacterium]